jgi:hypothetical protein
VGMYVIHPNSKFLYIISHFTQSRPFGSINGLLLHVRMRSLENATSHPSKTHMWSFCTRGHIPHSMLIQCPIPLGRPIMGPFIYCLLRESRILVDWLTARLIGGLSNGSCCRLDRVRSLGASRPLLPSAFRPGDCREPFRAPGSPHPTSIQVRLIYSTANMQGVQAQDGSRNPDLLKKACDDEFETIKFL